MFGLRYRSLLHTGQVSSCTPNGQASGFGVALPLFNRRGPGPFRKDPLDGILRVAKLIEVLVGKCVAQQTRSNLQVQNLWYK